jgi:translation elongation factor EF-Ts
MGTAKQKNVIEIKSDTDFIASDQQLSFDDFLKTVMHCYYMELHCIDRAFTAM